MARASKNIPVKKVIYVFWEGESEEAYSKYLKNAFDRSTVTKCHRESGTFVTAKSCYRDRGIQYTNKTFHDKPIHAGMVQSMSRVGRCIDNGSMEGYRGILKSEIYYLKKFTSKEELTQAIEQYIDFYNANHYQQRFECMTPMEYHQAFAA